MSDIVFEYILDDLDEYSYRLNQPEWTALLMFLIYPATWAIGVYRFGSWIRKKLNIPILRQIILFFYFILKRFTEILTGIEIAIDAEIGKGLFIGHLGGVVIGNKSEIGKHASFHQGVTIGGAGRGKKHGSPKIGDQVYFGAGAKVIGDIKVGNNVVIGANAVVTKSIPDNGVVGGIPAEIINFKGSSDFIHYRDKKIESRN